MSHKSELFPWGFVLINNSRWMILKALKNSGMYKETLTRRRSITIKINNFYRILSLFYHFSVVFQLEKYKKMIDGLIRHQICFSITVTVLFCSENYVQNIMIAVLWSPSLCCIDCNSILQVYWKYNRHLLEILQTFLLF